MPVSRRDETDVDDWRLVDVNNGEKQADDAEYSQRLDQHVVRRLQVDLITVTGRMATDWYSYCNINDRRANWYDPCLGVISHSPLGPSSTPRYRPKFGRK